MKLHPVPIWVDDPGLPALICPQFGVAYFDAAGAQRSDGRLYVVDLKRRCACTTDWLPGLNRALEKLNEVAPAKVEVDTVSVSSIIDETGGLRQAELVAIEGK